MERAFSEHSRVYRNSWPLQIAASKLKAKKFSILLSFFWSCLLNIIIAFVCSSRNSPVQIHITRAYSQFVVFVILVCMLRKVLADQQDSYIIKVSVILFCIASLILVASCVLNQIIDPYMAFTSQMSLIAIGKCFNCLLQVGLISLVCQLVQQSRVVFKFVIVYLIVQSVCKLLSIAAVKLILIDQENSNYYIAVVIFVLLIALFIQTQAYSVRRQRQELFGLSVIPTKRIRNVKDFLDAVYSATDLTILKRGKKPQRCSLTLTLALSFCFNFASSAVLFDEVKYEQEYGYWWVLILNILALILIMPFHSLALKYFYQSAFLSCIISSISLIGTVVVQVLRIHCSLYSTTANIVTAIVTQLSTSFLGIHMMGKITDYKRTNYKDMIYMFVVGEQAAYLLQNIVNQFQGRYIYVSSGISAALCIGSAICVHLIKYQEESPKTAPLVKGSEEGEKLSGDVSPVKSPTCLLILLT